MTLLYERLIFSLEWTTVDEDILMTAKWLACVHRSLDEFLDNQPVYDRLKAMKIIPLATYQRESTSDSTIFFPLSENAELSYNGKYLCHSDNFGITVLSIHFANVRDLLCNDIVFMHTIVDRK